MESNAKNGAPEAGNDRSELSEREREILVRVASGASNKLIAQQLSISPNTVKVHLRNIFGKIGVASRTEAALFAIRAGLVAVPGEAPIAVAEDETELRAETVPPIAQATDRRRAPWLWWAIGVLAAVALIAGATMAYYQLQPAPTAVPTLILPTPTPRWKVLADLSTPRSGLAVATHDNLVYAIAGQTAAGVTGAMERFDTATGAWTVLASKPVAVTDVEAAVVGGQIFVPGGRLETGDVTAALEVYDPRADQWERRADVPAPVSAYALTAFEGRLYLFGGWDGEAYTAAVYVYDPTMDRWSVGTPMPTARGYSGAAVAADRIYVVGGRNAQGAMDVNEAYAPGQSDLAWQTRAALPQPLAALGVASLADILYAFGGRTAGGRLGAWSYSTSLDTWQAIESPSVPQADHMGVTVLQTRLILLGGRHATLPSDQHLAYQAVYTTIFPGVSGE